MDEAGINMDEYAYTTMAQTTTMLQGMKASGRPAYTIHLRFIDDRVLVVIDGSEYIGDDIDHAMTKIKTHLVKARMTK
jgi:hypothetical protein